MSDPIPERVPSWIDGAERPAADGAWAVKRDPHDGKPLCELARSRKADVDAAVDAARVAQAGWDATPAVQRGLALHRLVRLMQDRADEIARIVSAETGKTFAEAAGETEAAVQCGLFFAGEGQRLYGRTCTSGAPDKLSMILRRPVGVAGLIVAANTPIANVAWKLFPALVCGNAVVLKAAEDTPATAWIVGKLAREAGIPQGVVNIVQGLGREAGAAIVEHPDVDLVSFTGSTEVGRYVQQAAGSRLARVSLELGGKNPLVVCDDADVARAVSWTALSAFSNAGQRCASCSRVIVQKPVYEQFRSALVARTGSLEVGKHEGADLGPVINERQLSNMLSAVSEARREGARVLIGGERLAGPEHAAGYYMAPTVVEGADPASTISTTELFGPILCMYQVDSYDDALELANRSPYGLTASIHTRDIDRALRFARDAECGVAVVNAGTHGSEPHMPFGGLKQSGNGSREPGTEAVDVYTELKTVNIVLDPSGSGRPA